MTGAPDRRDHIRAMLADLKLPGALEAVDTILAEVDRGGVAHSSACASNRSRRKNASSRLPKPQQPHLQ